jgi:hypothetical protein
MESKEIADDKTSKATAFKSRKRILDDRPVGLSVSSSSTASSSSSSSLADAAQLELLKCKLYQWCHANAMIRQSFEAQERDAIEKIEGKWKLYSSLSAQYHMQQMHLEREEEILSYATAVTQQSEAFDRLSDTTSELLKDYQQLYEALYATLHHLPTHGVTIDSDRLLSSLKEMSAISERTLGAMKDDVTTVEVFHDAAVCLKDSVDEHDRVLEEARDALAEMIELDRELQSLRIETILDQLEDEEGSEL